MVNPAPIFRVYRMKWRWRAFAFFFLFFGALPMIASLREFISGASDPKPMMLPVGVLFLAAGIGLTFYAFKAAIGFSQDAIEHRTIFGQKKLPLDGIKGRREYVVKGAQGDVGGNTRYLKLVPNDDRLPTLEFSKHYTFDDTFYRWFYELPDLDAEDRKVHKDSNFGLV